MIFVACGTQKFPLNSLLRKMDQLIEEGVLKEEVYAQIGNSTYYPKHYPWVRFMEGKEFEKKIKECRILVTHSGVGSIFIGKKHRKPIVVYPRSAKNKEHVDDHQWQIATLFSQQNYVLLCESEDVLEERIRECSEMVFDDIELDEKNVMNTVNSYLMKL